MPRTCHANAAHSPNLHYPIATAAESTENVAGKRVLQLVNSLAIQLRVPSRKHLSLVCCGDLEVLFSKTGHRIIVNLSVFLIIIILMIIIIMVCLFYIFKKYNLLVGVTIRNHEGGTVQPLSSSYRYNTVH